MQIQGTITHIEPTQQGGYQSQGGYVYTYMMTINTQNGPVTGEVGSKSNPYPSQIGEQIIVESTTNQHGVKFKKVNPQYQNQGQSQGGYQQPQQQRHQQQRATQQQQPLPGPDATGRMIIAQVSAKIVAELMVGTELRFNSTVDMQNAINDWFTAIINVGSGNIPAPPRQSYGGNQVPNQYSDQYSQDEPPITDDTIPY